MIDRIRRLLALSGEVERLRAEVEALGVRLQAHLTSLEHQAERDRQSVAYIQDVQKDVSRFVAELSKVY